MSRKIIHKFGGSCLREPDDLDKIAEVIQEDEQAILVVSALWGTTDRLYRAAKDPRYASRLDKICRNSISDLLQVLMNRKMRISSQWFFTT